MVLDFRTAAMTAKAENPQHLITAAPVARSMLAGVFHRLSPLVDKKMALRHVRTKENSSNHCEGRLTFDHNTKGTRFIEIKTSDIKFQKRDEYGNTEGYGCLYDSYAG